MPCLHVKGDKYCSIDWIALTIQEVGLSKNFWDKIVDLMLNLQTNEETRFYIEEKKNEKSRILSSAVITILSEWKSRKPMDKDANVQDFLQYLKKLNLNAHAQEIETRLASVQIKLGEHSDVHSHAGLESSKTLFQNEDITNLRAKNLKETETRTDNIDAKFETKVPATVVEVSPANDKDETVSFINNPGKRNSKNLKNVRKIIRKHQKFCICILAIILILGLGGGLHWIINKNSQKSNKSHYGNTNSESKMTTETPIGNTVTDGFEPDLTTEIFVLANDTSYEITTEYSLDWVTTHAGTQGTDVSVSLYLSDIGNISYFHFVLNSQKAIQLLYLNNTGKTLCKRDEKLFDTSNCSLSLPLLKSLTLIELHTCNNVLSLISYCLDMENLEIFTFTGILNYENTNYINLILAKVVNSLKVINISGIRETELTLLSLNYVQNFPYVKNIFLQIQNPTHDTMLDNILSEQFCEQFSNVQVFETLSGNLNANDFVTLLQCNQLDTLQANVNVSDGGNKLLNNFQSKGLTSVNIDTVKVLLNFKECPGYQFFAQLQIIFKMVRNLALCSNCDVQENSKCIIME